MSFLGLWAYIAAATISNEKCKFNDVCDLSKDKEMQKEKTGLLAVGETFCDFAFVLILW